MNNNELPLSEQAYVEIEQQIISQQLRPGTMISEKVLCASINLGRTPVREALIRLEREGLVEIHARRGAMITKIDLMQQLELLEVRRPLQVLAAQLAAKRATPLECETLKKYADAIREAAKEEDINAYLNINREVHQLEVTSAHNIMLEASLTLLQSMSRRFWFAFVRTQQETQQGANLHARLLETIAEKDVIQSENNANALVNFLEALTKKQIERSY